MNDTTPWSEEDILVLNLWQTCGMFHPYTCGNDSSHSDLVATKNGWVCKNCDYTQKWAHHISLKEMRMMLNSKLKNNL